MKTQYLNEKEKKKVEEWQKQADDYLRRLNGFPKEDFNKVKSVYELFRHGYMRYNEEDEKLEVLNDHMYFAKENMSNEIFDDKRPSVNRKMEIINIGGREVPVYYGSAPKFWKGKNEEWERWEEGEKRKLESMNGIQYPPGYFGPFRYHGDILAGQEIDPDKLMDIDTFFN